jgi:hypothetical protein
MWAAIILITIAGQVPPLQYHLSLHSTPTACATRLATERTTTTRKGYVIHSSGCIKLST